MTTFSYGFGIAISVAMALAIGNAWVSDHRKGVWTPSMIAIVITIAVAFGVCLGWSLNAYLAFVAASQTGRM
jgi:Na+-translocating ferredoxin:NAD+ oxidoreductase RnfE subunit